MGLVVGASQGSVRVWIAKSNEEKWAVDCICSKQTRGKIVMCWGIIMYENQVLFICGRQEQE